MWQRFTERARKIVFYAQEEAQSLGEGYVSTEHLLLGLTREEDSTAAQILNRQRVGLKQLRKEIEKQLPRGESRPGQDMTLTPRAKRVIDLSYDEARGLNNNYIGTEHLLLGLIREGDGLAGKVLTKLKVTLEASRQAAREIQGNEGVRHDPPEPTSPELAVNRSRSINLPVRFDFQLLHPIDQMLLSLLSDIHTPLGLRLRRRCSSLDWLLPSIVGTMLEASKQRHETLEQVMEEAQRLSEQETFLIDRLFSACVKYTSDEVRAVLRGLGLIEADLADEEEQG